METVTTLPRAELLRRAVELGPLLRNNAQASEEQRRLSIETLEALGGSGLLRMRVPRRFGGYESDMRTVTEVLAELARGDGSTAWTAAVWLISSWMVGLFPDSVREEVFADPDVRISGILSPSAMAVPVDGGYHVNGKWSFNTGCLQSAWNVNAAVRPTPDGQYEPVMVLIPMTDLQVIDDWHTTGMRGSGSVSTVAENVFVPEDRLLPMGPVIGGAHPLQQDPSAPMWRAPFMPIACTTVGAVAYGLAQAARDAFLTRLPGRKITYTDYDEQSAAPLTHHQVAGATIRVDEAGFHILRTADQIDTKAATGEPWTLEERARARLDLGAVCLRAKEAADLLAGASGGTSLQLDVPIQRIERDIKALNLHAIMHPDTNFELYGRVACGLAPNTQYL
ncbi:acyl-CoA dehydrogenase [Micromonospora sp. DR5-3]|uniref:acyl-CoA dehydrogenase family protein n=1 Tax=unclassified Micromonospora TaxID=2617518 RepID=UPI0011D58B16|nr:MULTISPECIES: acyl-CoA dehydrogenase family protein [unclassified Micromonospora]MCW3818299.1 acyl-CoA dehydrogenase [Micromonospora sp. DR5-3]TYC21174.1 acyl-CoA dehydrogenase [Micromonospora sp. MP36]